MSDRRDAWALTGIIAGLTGLATSFFVAQGLQLRASPVVAVADLVIRHTPAGVAERLIQQVGHKDKPLLVTGIVVALVLLFALAGRLARRNWAAPTLVFLALAVVGALAVGSEHSAAGKDQVPVVAGLLTWLAALAVLTEPLRPRDDPAQPEDADKEADVVAGGDTRRGFLLRAGVVAAIAAVVGVAGRYVGRGRREVEAARSSLQLPEVTTPTVPHDANLPLEGLTPWVTPAGDFYRVDTAITPPTILPDDWSLRIHGLVDREITLSFQDLLDRKFTQAWITLNCVSNPVGGNLIGNAWWSGVRLADLLAEAGPQAGADAVKQTSDDGWTCGTPLGTLTDDRNALLVVAMNGEPLPVEHGFPVRTLVPGLYGYVSACKWVRDMEVTRFSDFTAFWTEQGWSEQGPVKLSSRVDVPTSGAHVDAGLVRFAGVAWSQHTGISAVEYSLDGGAWQPAHLGREPSIDSWVQWTATTSVAKGSHLVRVRAVDRDGRTQTGVRRDVLPNGATGWASSDFTAG